MKRKHLHAMLALTMVCSFFAPAASAFAEEASAPAEVVSAEEVDFNGIWKCESMSLFGMSLDAAEYGLENSFIEIQDGKLSAASTSGYGDEEISDIGLSFADGKYSIALDEDLINQVQGETETSDFGDDETLAKLKELTAGNSSKMDFEMESNGNMRATIYVDLQNEYLTFATHMEFEFAPSNQGELDAAMSSIDTSDDIDEGFGVTSIDDAQDSFLVDED